MHEQSVIMLRALVAMQVAVLEWDNDLLATQSEARQALIGIQEAMNAISLANANMRRITEKRRSENRG